VPTVRIPPVLRPEAGNNRHVEANGQTVREVLESLVDSYPSLRGRIFEGDDLPQFLNVFIDGTDVRLNEGLETPVAAGSTVVLLPAVAGGAAVAAPPASRQAPSGTACDGAAAGVSRDHGGVDQLS
jgi:molybdopterin converting factor small subunit